MQDLKADSVLFLTRDGADGMDRDAARLFGRCEVELLHVGPDKSEQPSVDVLIHAKRDVIHELKAADFAGRVENAIRQTAAPRVRYLQWVEESISHGPSGSGGIGDGQSGG